MVVLGGVMALASLMVVGEGPCGLVHLAIKLFCTLLGLHVK